MNEIPVASFRCAGDLFRERVRGEFGERIVSEILDPMERELEALASETERAADEIAALESELENSAE